MIGFLNTSYTVNKSDGLVRIQLGITNNGVLETTVAINFSISQNQSNQGKTCKKLNLSYCSIEVLP